VGVEDRVIVVYPNSEIEIERVSIATFVEVGVGETICFELPNTKKIVLGWLSLLLFVVLETLIIYNYFNGNRKL